MDQILREGRNCWKIANASRVKFLIDGAAYFSTLADALEQARESIFILGWDFDSRIHLKLDAEQRGKFPDLGAFLNSLAARQPALHIHILTWDFAMIFALDREVVPFFAPGWRRHPRVHFHMDGDHPVGASHHAKIVVIDDNIAFVGGLDLAKGRWDTPEHRPQDFRRVDFSDAFPPPHHDVQIAVALGEIARKSIATGAARKNDFNEWLPIGRSLRWLHASVGKCALVRTFPAAFPVFALDRIWVSPPAALVNVFCVRTSLARVASTIYR